MHSLDIIIERNIKATARALAHAVNDHDVTAQKAIYLATGVAGPEEHKVLFTEFFRARDEEK
jgi:hypothetical protein